MENARTFSIIMPVYNASNYIVSTLESLIQQTYQNWEVIIVNDGSTDNSQAIIERYQQKDKRIKLYNQSNKGVSQARNVALKKISGDYVAFVDSDDWVDADWLETIQATITKHPATDLLVYGWVNEIATGNSNYHQKKNNFEEHIFKNNDEFKKYYTEKYCRDEFPGFCWNKIYAAKIIDTDTFDTNLDIVEDEIFNYGIYKKVTNVITMNWTPYHYRIEQETSLTKSHRFQYKPEIYSKSKYVYTIKENLSKDWDIQSNEYMLHIEYQYILALYDNLYNSMLFAPNKKLKLENIEAVMKDKNFKKKSKKTLKSHQKNAVFFLMATIKKINNKHIVYYILMLFLVLLSKKNYNF